MSTEKVDEKTGVFVTSENTDPTISQEKVIHKFDESHKHQLYEKLGHAHIIDDETIPDIEFLFEKCESMPIDEALEIVKQTVEDFDDDPNFPSEDYEELKVLAQGPEASPELSETEYNFKVVMYAVLTEYHSPYPEVRAITSPTDDPDVPIETIRAYVLGFIWTIIGTGVNEFFSHRQPGISLSSSVCQMLLYPCGMFCQYVLPDWGFTLFGTRHSLNPGPWSYKEQMFATIIFDVSIGGIYVSYNIYVQKLDVYYGNDWVSVGYQVFLALSTQLLGFGLAGVLRKVVVYPVRAVWPTLLPTLALNRALLKPEKKENIHGWTISRYYFFFAVFSGSFLYFWFPDYVFQALSYFNWMTWIAPDNFNLAMITGSVGGLGLNPITSFDWNIIGWNKPLAIPFYTYANTMIGMFIAFFAICGVYWTNYKWSAYFPINTNKILSNTGDRYQVREIITNGRLDKEKYAKYGPPYYSAANLVVYGSFFAIYPFTIVYVFCTEWKAIYSSFIHLKSIFTDYKASNFTHFKDPHSRMMSRYKETPDYWFVGILLLSLVFAIICVKAYPANTPVWGIFFTIAINFIFLIPLTIVYSVTGFSFGLNVLVELIIGYAIPGNGDALNTLKALGYNIGGQAENYITDQKMAHYAKIPPRAIFRGQLLSTLLQVLVALLVINWQIRNVKNICTSEAANNFTCPSENTFYSASVLWGVIGPKKVFSELYPILKYCFLIGFLLGIVFVGIKWYFKDRITWFQPVVIIGGLINFAPYNLSYYIPGFYVSYVFNHYIKKRYTSWWEKYNYILSSALDAGVAFSAIIIFFAVQYHEKDINWWGNNVPYAGIDGGYGQQTLLNISSAPDGYVGLRYGSFST